MSKDSKFDLIKITDIFEGREFIIPDYQRGYSWENLHTRALFDDIIFAKNLKDYVHYMGTIIVVKNNNKYEIIDGQQRITTFAILIKALSFVTHSNPEISKFYNKISLELNKETNDFYVSYIVSDSDKNKPKNIYSHNLRNCYNNFKRLCSELQEKQQLTDFFEAITEKIGFILYIAKNDKNVSAMFEVVNNRGKSLSQLEKVKNYIIYHSILTDKKSLRKKINAIWGNVLNRLMICYTQQSKMTQDDFEDSFLRYFWVVFSETQIRSSYNVYELVKSKFPLNEDCSEEINSFLNFLEISSLAYEELFTNYDGIYCNIRNQTTLAPILPLFISIFNRKDLDKEKKTNLYDLLEKLNFRVYGIPSKRRADADIGVLYRLAHNFYYNNLESDDNTESDQYSILHRKLISFIENRSPLNSFVENLTLDIDEEYNYNKWKGLKYFLANYEVYLAKEDKQTENIEMYLKPYGEQTNDKFEKEHIWAKNNRPHITESNHQKSRLGNFILLNKGNNIDASNLDLVKFKVKNISKLILKDDKGKLEIYNKLAKQLRQVKKIEYYDNSTTRKLVENSNKIYDNRFYAYYQKIIDLNEQDLINFAIKRWSVEDDNITEYKIDSVLGECINKNEKEHKRIFFSIQEYKELRRKYKHQLDV